MAELWETKVPFNTGDNDFIPQITPYPAESKGAVIIFPGGGYSMKAAHEGPVMAEWLQSVGITSFVVDYRVAPYAHPAQISDAMRAVKYVRFYASRYGIDQNKIAVMGSSAGGHLAASVSVHYDKQMYDDTDRIDKVDCRPNLTILCYPVIDMGLYRHDGSRQNLLGTNVPDKLVEFMSVQTQVNENTPEAFIWTTATDDAVPAMNSLLYAQALASYQIPYELHIFPRGHHGLGLAPDEPYVAKWAEELRAYLRMKNWK